jgi:hypothetical protein
MANEISEKENGAIKQGRRDQFTADEVLRNAFGELLDARGELLRANEHAVQIRRHFPRHGRAGVRQGTSRR